MVRLRQPPIGDLECRHANVARRVRQARALPSRARSHRGRRASTAHAAACASRWRFSACSVNAFATDRSPRSTSSRCAVSRHQPLGCDERVDELRGRGLREGRLSIALRRVVHDPVDAPVATWLIELARQDLVAQVFGDEALVLDDAVVHVHDVERAVRAPTRGRPAGIARRSTRGTPRRRTPSSIAASCRRR